MRCDLERQNRDGQNEEAASDGAAWRVAIHVGRGFYRRRFATAIDLRDAGYRDRRFCGGDRRAHSARVPARLSERRSAS